MSDRDSMLARYIGAAFDDITREVAMSKSGGRTEQLFKSACKLGSYIGARALSESEVTSALERAARENGLVGSDGLKAVTVHIKRGIARGIASPADLSKIELKANKGGDRRSENQSPNAAALVEDAIPHKRKSIDAGIQASKAARKLSPDWMRFFRACDVIKPADIGGAYLLSRDCAIPPEDGDLRWHPNAFNWVTRDRWPALVGLVTDTATNTPISLHFTFIAQDGSGKAPIKPQRLFLKDHEKADGVVRLWPDAHVTHGLLVGEGIETTLSAARAFQPAWACLDAGNLGTFPILPGIESITIAEDEDDAGRRHTKACAERWAAAGRDVRILRAA